MHYTSAALAVGAKGRRPRSVVDNKTKTFEIFKVNKTLW